MSYWEWFETATSIFKITILFMFAKNFLGHKKQYYLKGIISIIILCTFNYISNEIFPNHLITVAVSLICFSIQSFLLESSIKQKILTSILSVTFIIISEILTVFLIMILGTVNTQKVFDNGVLQMLGNTISTVILLLITRSVCVFRKNYNIAIPIIYWIGLLSISITSSVSAYSIFYINDKHGFSEITPLSFTGALGLLLVNVFVVILIETLIGKLNDQKNSEMFQQQIENQSSFYRAIELSYKENRSIRHDLDNHLNSINGLIINEQYDDAKSYINKIIDLDPLKKNFVSTGNTVIDALFSAKIRLAEEFGITVNKIIEIPSDLKFNSVDACIIFGNSLDNAIEACSKIKEGEKFIDIFLKYERSRLFYKIRNSTANIKLKMEGKFYKTTKKSKSFHGFGLENINRVVERYNGILKLRHENSVFELEFIIFIF